MGWYQEYLGDSDVPTKIYHMCPRGDWEERPMKATYYSSSYKTEKVIRCIHDASKLMETANCFYKEKSPLDVAWVCLEVDTICLRMNGIEIKMVQSELEESLTCPHVQEGIPQEGVTNTFRIQRDEKTGEFLFIVGLTDACTGHHGSTKITV
mmetsp:Transcript_4051/g.5322  ORF Transcript_4051/g.5322 Transcript_4051/m.5322 type:complete len:152 (+) Transcript_4051:214-669(+)|eukprot:CAMPEP_0198138922 /NCGR_PEP_ID=MMETSP1443-20131203/2290_1 /TAXON_ID=186043 /ORGANISM="Entomoneis sp., Strain CCMP2396" /LENGTH=151 /DNA_ID=CAMNT_0043800879 /DNA_START=188 /DNA_END=643 /DNA_ORIENTATION=+